MTCVNTLTVLNLATLSRNAFSQWFHLASDRTSKKLGRKVVDQVALNLIAKKAVFDVHTALVTMINIVIVMFAVLFMTSIVGTVLQMANLKGIPKCLYDIYYSGKSCEGKLFSTLLSAVLVPKSWFFHFYFFATVYTLLILIMIIWMILTKNQLPIFITMYIDFVSPHSCTTIASAKILLLATLLFLLQVFRRAYESMYVTVFLDSKMNIGHYVVGYLHYWGCGTILLLYAACQSLQDNQMYEQANNEIHLQHIIGIALFIIAFYQQYKAHITLANLRKNPQSKQKYSLPQGGLFNYVSCPNFLCEIIIYLAINLVLGIDFYPWTLVTFWVLSNQIMAAIMTQKWYKSKFKEFPPTRKALIPFVY
ncbi:polyprenol reductase-like [Daphnia carinata]|uniref:polyprenol reductase-like n=1 Tax=Daphnia carinata TaxID=120202 RepID=UPI002868735E|nr:polyprenol reductase-like [Daphnia carinata]